MNLRLATLDDLPKLKTMYREIIASMHQKGLTIWDEVYPCEFFACDIEKHRLHLLVDCTDTIVAAFTLCESNSGEPYVTWENRHGKAFYLERLGVSAAYPRRGLGSKALQTAMALAKQNNADYLRLFVLDINTPAINLYCKNGFRQAGGVYEERIDEDLTLREYGFEIPL